MDLSLSGKHALVCGSTQGIGKAIAYELALLGARITLVARNEEKLKSVATEIGESTLEQVDYLVADFTNPSNLKEIVAAYVQKNPIHILVNNTGGPPGGQAIDADVASFLAAFNSHLVCNQILAQAVVESMKKAGFGRIINVVSTSVKMPLKGLGVSNTIRGAVANWSKTLSIELAPFGITVNNVLPGATNTVRLESIIQNKAKKTGKKEAEIESEMLGEIPAQRFAEAKEVAAAAAFLASPAAAYINGINVPVDGGRTGCL